MRAGRAGGPSASPSLRAGGTKWRRGLPGYHARPRLPRQPAAPPSGRQGAPQHRPRPPALSHKTPRRRPPDLFPASNMAVSSGTRGPRRGCAISIRRHPSSGGPGRTTDRAGGSGGGREGELRDRYGQGGAGGPPWGRGCHDRPRPARWLGRCGGA